MVERAAFKPQEEEQSKRVKKRLDNTAQLCFGSSPVIPSDDLDKLL